MGGGIWEERALGFLHTYTHIYMHTHLRGDLCLKFRLLDHWCVFRLVPQQAEWGHNTNVGAFSSQRSHSRCGHGKVLRKIVEHVGAKVKLRDVSQCNVQLVWLKPVTYQSVRRMVSLVEHAETPLELRVLPKGWSDEHLSLATLTCEASSVAVTGIAKEK